MCGLGIRWKKCSPERWCPLPHRNRFFRPKNFRAALSGSRRWTGWCAAACASGSSSGTWTRGCRTGTGRSRSGPGYHLEKVLFTCGNLFLVLACHWPVLDVFDQHFQATVLFSSKQCHWITLATWTIFSSENILESLGIEPGSAGSGNKFAKHGVMVPSTCGNLLEYVSKCPNKICLMGPWWFLMGHTSYPSWKNWLRSQFCGYFWYC